MRIAWMLCKRHNSHVCNCVEHIASRSVVRAQTNNMPARQHWDLLGCNSMTPWPAAKRTGLKHRYGREVRCSILGPVKSETVSPTARYRCDVSSWLCCPMPRCDAAEMGPVLHASAQYRENDEHLICELAKNKHDLIALSKLIAIVTNHADRVAFIPWEAPVCFNFIYPYWSISRKRSSVISASTFSLQSGVLRKHISLISPGVVRKHISLISPGVVRKHISLISPGAARTQAHLTDLTRCCMQAHLTDLTRCCTDASTSNRSHPVLYASTSHWSHPVLHGRKHISLISPGAVCKHISLISPGAARTQAHLTDLTRCCMQAHLTDLTRCCTDASTSHWSHPVLHGRKHISLISSGVVRKHISLISSGAARTQAHLTDLIRCCTQAHLADLIRCCTDASTSHGSHPVLYASTSRWSHPVLYGRKHISPGVMGVRRNFCRGGAKFFW